MPARFPRDARLLGLKVAFGLAPAVSKIEGYQPLPIEASNQLPNGIATPTPIGPSGVGKAPTAGYGEEYFGARLGGSGVLGDVDLDDLAGRAAEWLTTNQLTH